MTNWNYNTNDLKKRVGDTVLICLVTSNKKHRQLTTGQVRSKTVVMSRGVDVTEKIYAWCDAPDLAPLKATKKVKKISAEDIASSL